MRRCHQANQPAAQEILIGAHPRSSAAKYSCLPRRPGRPRPSPPQPSTPPSSGTPQAHRRPRGPVPRHGRANLSTATRTPRAPDDRRTASRPPPHPRAPSPTHPPVTHPVRSHPQTASARRNPYAQRNRLRTQPSSRETHAVRQPASARHNPYAQRNAPRTQPPAGQSAPPANPHPAAATPCAQRNLRALRALRGGPCCRPRRQASALTRYTPNPAYCPLGQDRRSKANP